MDGTTRRRGCSAGAAPVPPAKLIIATALRGGVRVLQCPQCGSTDLYYEAGMVTGHKYHCKKCDYIGAFVIERDLPEE